MKHFSKLTFDPHKGRIYFDGGCDEVRDVCGAMCCRTVYSVDLSEEEYKSGSYKYDMICCFSGQACVKAQSMCVNRRYVLSKKEDGSCAYLDPSNKCSIYEKRPRTCRDFDCSAGWQIFESVRPEGYEKTISDALKATIKRDAKFSPNPGAAVKTIFYSAASREAVFVMESPARCGYLPLKCGFSGPAAGDEALLFIYRSFDGRRSIGEIYGAAAARFGPGLTEDAFLDAVTLFFRRGLIIFKHCARDDKEQEGRHE